MEKFIVSARKYRPLTFESVVGQHHITSTLRNAITREQVAHAYLFCGPRGVGKTTCARILSKSLNCLNRRSDGEACGECESCIAFAQSRSFNIHELDAASNNSVENIRSLNEQVRIPPQIGRYSIYIIDEAHMLSTAAFNAFLKTLEEPPAHAIFILATTEKHKILPTILSRCQIYDFKRIKVEDTVKFLGYICSQESVTSDDESLHIVAQKADGCMRDALSMYDKVVSFCGHNLQFKEVAEALNVLDYDSYFTFVDSYSSGDYQSALLQFDTIMQKGFEALTFLGGLSSHLRNLLVAADAKTLPLLEVTGSIAARYSAQGVALSAGFIFDSLSIIATAENSARTSLNVRLHCEITILKLCNLSPIKLSTGAGATPQSLPKVEGAATAVPQQAAAVQQPTAVQQAAAVQQPPRQAAPPQPQVAQPAPQKQAAPQVVPQPAPQPTPEPKKQPAPQQQRKSLLGISINNMLESAPEPKKGEGKQSSEPTANALLPEELYSSVLEGCKEYSQTLQKRRPRLAEAFSRAEVKDGKVWITVPNNILYDEVNSDRHSIISQMLPLCKVSNLQLEVEVDPNLVPEQRILLKDEDKLKFLSEQNKTVMQLCKKLDLDYI